MKTGSHPSFVRTRTGYSIIICLALLCACFSCRDKKKAPAVKHAVVPGKADLSVEDFAQTLKPVLPVIDTADSTWIRQPLPASAAAMALVYQLNDYEPVWLNEDGVLAFADSLIAELDSLQWDGLPAARYQLPQLQELKAKALSHSASLPDLISFDTLCTRAYLMASRDLLLGVELPRKADTLWFHSNDSLWNGWRSLAALNQSRAYPSLSAYRSAWPAYELMRAANRHYAALAQDTVYQSLHAALRLNMPDSLLAALLQRQMPWLSTGASDSLSETKQLIQGFQYYFGQRVTAKLDTATYKKLQLSPDSVRQLIGLNLERMRWMNQSPGTDYIIVPIPLMELFLVHKDEPGMHMRVVVGKPSRQTPSLNANMANVVLNPPWGVPPTILKKDVAPGLAKSGGAYLARKGLRAFDAKGKVISAGQINGSNYRRFFYRQEPGARNALGEVKFNLPNKWDIYLHDTPHKEDFPNRNRAKSSGCIRVARPKDMAEYILSEMEGKKRFSPEYIDSVISTRKTRYELLQHKIPVHIVYLTAYPDSSAQALRLLDDVYGHDSRMLARTGTIAKKS